MRKNGTLILALSGIVLGHASGLVFSGETAGSGQYYCPPGAKFCPAPGADNTVYLDTHFGVDAKTGQMTAYKGTAHPDEALNPNLTTEEQVLFTSPPISVENRYVPYPGSPQTNMAATTTYAAQPAQAQYYAPPVPGAPRNAQARPRMEAAESEVANQQASRVENKKSVTKGDKVPWYKGGVWRNRKRGDKDDGPSNDPIDSKPRASVRASPQSEDMWGDDDFDGYNSDGSPTTPSQQNYAAAPAGDPFGAPQQQYDPYSQPGAAHYAGDPYTMPNSPPPSTPYQPGYVYPGTDLSYESTFQGGYDTQPQYIVSSPQEVIDPFAQPAMTMPPNDAAGSPQFENAVRMVKENRFSEAKNLLASETSRNPSNAAAWRWLADCHYNLLELNDAIGCYQRALDSDANDYYALRGQGFSYLHRGHEYWRRMQEEVSMRQKDQAAATFAQAHDDYKRSLELLGLCLRRAPNDGEAIYGEAMAAEGASRKLYSNVISYLKLGPEHRGRAELFAENCLTVINKGIERSRERAGQMPGDTGPRALLAGLYLRKAILYHQLGKNDLALLEVSNSRDVQKSILDEIDSNNATAQKGLRECENYWREWGGER